MRFFFNSNGTNGAFENKPFNFIPVIIGAVAIVIVIKCGIIGAAIIAP